MTDDTLFDSQNAAYAQAMFEEYARNPESVPASWRKLFENGASLAIAEGLLVPEQLAAERSAPPSAAPSPGPAPAQPGSATPPPEAPPAPGTAPPSAPPAASADASDADLLRTLLPAVSRAAALVQAFRDHGHQLATIDPLGTPPQGHPQLSPVFHGTSIEELSQIPATLVVEDAAEGQSVADALAALGEIYTSTIGYEFEHLDDHVKVDWLWDQVEAHAHRPTMSAEERRALLERIAETEGLEQFLHRAYLGQKRFSIEGTDMLVPMLDLVIERAARDGAREVVLGMAHRGRLNVLTHIVGVSYGELLAEFEGSSMRGGQLDIPGTGDVKYHHGARGTRAVQGVGDVAVTLAPNPSHLEFVNPVVLGMARSHQFSSVSKGSRPDTRTVVPVLIHGDAAFAAEGVVAETLNMARLEGYHVGGTIHVIVNNQVGFTTNPREGRSTYYASDLAKGYGIPVIHVNADDPEACLAAVRLAMAYRARFRDDFVIDLVGYRRHGHNEGDEPAYTQPMLYAKIAQHPTVGTLYGAKLVEEGVLEEDEVQALREGIAERLREVQDNVRDYEPKGDDPIDAEREIPVLPESTGVALERLEAINNAMVQVPDDFTPHPKLWRQLGRRASVFSPNRAVDWGHAETLAFGTLLMEGIPIRLTGQDAQRGTFSHRHLVLHDAEDGRTLVPLRQVADARLEIYNSPLTETAVVGFEYGYSVGAETDVVLWEAQFGDFANVAQVMIDQFLSSGFTKWGQYSRITLLLPHGYEGQGPEHSSARLERFLQLCAEENMRVSYPTTPAQYFHLIRRQALRRPERPMVVMTPKSLLRHPKATSTIAELTEGTFRHVLPDPTVEDPSAVTRLVLCSGKIYYDIQGHDRRAEASDVAVGRAELLYPFPAAALEGLLERYPNLEVVVWAQEEPRNMGALTFIGPRLRAVVPRHVKLAHASRPERASPAEGKSSDHNAVQAGIVLEALGLEASPGD